PDWNPPAIAAARAQAAAGASATGEKLFRLPEGYLKIQPGMSREGKRYAQGESLVPDVVKKEEDRFEIKGFIVELTRAGPLIGAICSCPDFKYRGSKFKYACKHIWSVVLKEKLLE
ncbi:MAG: SWIM zinc finger domain-containing protein, partial [Candidatus Aureabacteria bacterium]|nr:SWIM zinc finger domain-containing protein [Candidatus Auribacterota bacterium]